MKIHEAINRIKWRMEIGGWKSNETDILAFNRVVDFVISEQESLLERNVLFAKLYVLAYSCYIEKFKTTIYNEIPIKELHKFIEKPLVYHINTFCRDLNTMEQQKLFSELDFSFNHPSTIDKSIEEKEIKTLLKALNEKNNTKRFFGCVWSFNEVEGILINQIINFLNDYNFKEVNNKFN